MLGLSQLIRDSDIEQCADRFFGQIANKRLFSHNSLERPFLLYKENIHKKQVMRNLGATSYFSNYFSHPKIGLHAVQEWQLSDANNRVLTFPHFIFVGVSLKVGFQPLAIGDNEKNIEKKTDKKSLYITQCYTSLNNQNVILSSIKITHKINAHLKEYTKYFCFDLNKFLIGNDYFHRCGLDKEINRDSTLDKIAKKQLLYSANREEVTEDIQKIHERKVKEKKKSFYNIHARLLCFSCYIPACRLVYSEGGLPDEIKFRLKNGDFNRFGMRVKLFKNKIFKVSIIFGKTNKSF
ncbi:hypothetical protein CDIK_4082 [Cucumispora dikerogammari]|nr:hypothetical protein CDIK_4082 [Cucumispora dikerogammari]